MSAASVQQELAETLRRRGSHSTMDRARPLAPGSAEAAFAPPRRVYTAPMNIPNMPPPQPQQHQRSTSPSSSVSGVSETGSSAGAVEILYNHPSVKIVSFMAGPRNLAISPRGGLAAPAEPEPGTLPWSSQLERTIAVGPFRIYRAPGSVAFLNCGSALQPILPKSQCWCIDEESSKFILQIRRPQYWRIELPMDVDPEHDERARLLREVLDQILQFEKTPCPFIRDFYVELPELPDTPLKKRPWTPIKRVTEELPPSPVTPADVTPRARLFTERGRSSLPRDVEEARERVDLDALLEIDLSRTERGPAPIAPIIRGIEDRLEKSREEREAEMERDSARQPRAPRKASEPTLARSSSVEGRKTRDLPQGVPEKSGLDWLSLLPGRLASFQFSRSGTAPPELSFDPSSPSKSRGKGAAATSSAQASARELGPTETADRSPSPAASFHSIQSWHTPNTPLPPSPPLSNPDSPKTFPYPHNNIAISSQTAYAHPRDASDTTTTPRQNRSLWELSGMKSGVTTIESSSEESSIYEDAQKIPCSQPTKYADSTCQTVPFPDIADAPTARSTAVAATSTSSNNTEAAPRPRIRHRATTSTSISVARHRALSPLPPAANLFTPHRQFRTYNSAGRAATRLEAMRRIPGSIIRKTCEILLAPPAYLIALMLKVAARIAAGEWRGLVFGIGADGETIPVRWDYSDDDDGISEPGVLPEYHYPTVGGWYDDEDVAADDYHLSPMGGGPRRRSAATTAYSAQDSPTLLRKRSWVRGGEAGGSGSGTHVSDTDDRGRSWEVD